MEEIILENAKDRLKEYEKQLRELENDWLARQNNISYYGYIFYYTSH